MESKFGIGACAELNLSLCLADTHTHPVPPRPHLEAELTAGPGPLSPTALVRGRAHQEKLWCP